jgi:hypothetical protein
MRMKISPSGTHFRVYLSTVFLGFFTAAEDFKSKLFRSNPAVAYKFSHYICFLFSGCPYESAPTGQLSFQLNVKNFNHTRLLSKRIHNNCYLNIYIWMSCFEELNSPAELLKLIIFQFSYNCTFCIQNRILD